MSASAEATVLITHEVGLHARPSVKFTKLAKSFAAEVEVAVAANGPWFDAKSIVKVMAAKAPKGTMLHIRARGDGAEQAVGALVDL
ncbi:MAG: HPr family phosphocarrier protein, partial [Mesorhizobium sp.]